MTDRAEIERLLNKTGRTLEGLPERDKWEEREAMWARKPSGVLNADIILHQSDVIELLVSALRDALDKQPKWIRANERLPENEKTVLIAGWREGISGKLWPVVMTAFHIDGKMLAQDSCYAWSEGSVEMEYDEDADDFVVPEGWFEEVQCSDEFSMVYDIRITHWMPLPEPPKEDA